LICCLPRDETINIVPYGKPLEALLDTVVEKLQQGNKEIIFEKVDFEVEARLLIDGYKSLETSSALTPNSH